MTKKRKHDISLYTCKAKRQTKPRPRTNYYLYLREKVELMKTCKESGLVLYEYYLSKAGQPDYAFDDDSVAKALEWSPSKVKKNRLRLKHHGYFLQRKGVLHDGGNVVITYLDPDQIKQLKLRTSANQTLGDDADSAKTEISAKSNPDLDGLTRNSESSVTNSGSTPKPVRSLFQQN